MNEEQKKWLIKSMGFGAGFALTLAVLVAAGFWYLIRPKPPKPWNRMAITSEFIEPAVSNDKDIINLWYTLSNTTDTDYRVDSLSEITTAGLTADDDALYSFNQGISFDVPLIVPAHRKTKVILHVIAPTNRLSIADDASDAAVNTYKADVLAFLRSEYANMKGLAIMDDRRRYEIDLPLGKRPSH